MASIRELKDIIVDLKVSLAETRVPRGNCPLHYFKVSSYVGLGCDTGVSCDVCKDRFFEQYRKDCTAEVRNL